MRIAGLLLATLILSLLAAAICRALGLTVFRPEMPLLIALYTGFSVGNQRVETSRPSWIETAVIGLCAGYLGDLLAGAPIGLNALACLIVALTARGLADRLLLSAFWRTALVAWFFAVGHGAIVMSVLAAVGAVSLARQLPLVLGVSVASGLCAPIVFAMLAWLGTRAQQRDRGFASLPGGPLR